MGTRAAAFTAKIRNLHDYQLRLLHGIMPVPSGVDVGNTLKYFSQTLLTVLKDVPGSPMEMLKQREKDSVRMGLYPNLDYKGLYNALVQMVDVVPLVQYGAHVFGQSMVQCMCCILAFLESEMLDELPYMVAATVPALPSSLHQEIVNALCFYILPFTITRYSDEDEDNYAIRSVPAIIMMVFQYSQNPAHHCQLLESLMTYKRNVVKDLLCVIAYGTLNARASAAKLLFYYWPTFNPNLFDRRVVLQKFTNLVPFVCQRDMCPNQGNTEAAKLCYDHCISITFASDRSPPLYLCIECANEIHREHPNQMFYDILHPMQQVSMTCENKNCRSSDKYAISICFSTECASYNGNHPIRYCQQCHNIRHNNRRGGDHIFHMCLPPLGEMNAEMQTYMVESVVSLLKEAKPISVETFKDPADIQGKPDLLNVSTSDSLPVEERQLLGRYGVWLLVGLCTPNEATPIDILGRLLSMLFHWFDVTSYSFEDEKNTLERLKKDFVCGWLANVCSSHFQVFVSCLLPHPPDYARVGGHWDTLVSRTIHLKEGLNRMFCLVPYDIISLEIWDYVMPHWLEAMVNDVPEKELNELKILLSKILDSDMSPLGFDTKKLFRFITVRFKKTTAKVQEQALHWLQVLSMLGIVIPRTLLFSIFGEGVKGMKAVTKERLTADKLSKKEDGARKSSISPVVEDDSGNTSPLSDDELPTSRHMEFETDAELNLTCCVLMLDVLLKQLELQEVERHAGIHTALAQDVCRLLRFMLCTSWVGVHTCATSPECQFCETCVVWHQLALALVQMLCPDHPVSPPDPQIDEQTEENLQTSKNPPESEKKAETKQDSVINIAEGHSVGGVLAHMPRIMTVTVDAVAEQLDLTPIITSESYVSTVANSVVVTDTDAGMATVQVAQPLVQGEVSQSSNEGQDGFWHTSVGKFCFALQDLPEQLQFIYHLLKEMVEADDPEILYHMLQSLNVLCLYGDTLASAAKEQRGFLIWCQENLLIKNLWELCDAEHSHICQVCVPLLLHCITLSSGSDMFWKVVQDEFHSTDWRDRFVAVERVTVIARFMDSTPLRSSHTLQAALATAFCYLICSMDDMDVLVAQRATLYLGTIHDSAIKSLILCLETQFDLVIVDRPMVLQSLYQLHNCLSDRKIITWEFFLNRFDALFLEAQISLEKSGDVAYMRDLRNTDLSSEVFIRKLHRAHEALSQQSDGSGGGGSGPVGGPLRTLSASFGPKWPYKRTMSAPASITPRQDVKQGNSRCRPGGHVTSSVPTAVWLCLFLVDGSNRQLVAEKEKVYNRQYSAPILKRKSSRFGLGQLLGTIPSSNSMPDGHIHSLNINSGEDSNMVGFLHRVIELEESDRETMHLLVFLFIQFLSRSDQAYPSDDKAQAKVQAIVLHHLYLLLGYNQNERGFHVPPQKLRTSPVFNVFVANLPQLLDQNHLMGKMLLPTCLILLQYCPCPHQGFSPDQQAPVYSLWYLESHTRRCWLMAVLVLLYKYQYNQQPCSGQVQSLVKIVLNTLDAQHHQCNHIPATLVMGGPHARSRDVSQPSLGGEAEHSGGGGGGADKFETPPLSPLYSGDGSAHVSVSTKGGKMTAMFHQKSGGSMETHWEEEVQCPPRTSKRMPQTSFSIDADETESELAAIPESPRSDSTLHGTAQDSFEEGTSMEEGLSEAIARSLALRETPQLRQMVRTTSQESEQRRPVWFLGSEEDAVQTSNGESEGEKASSSRLSTSLHTSRVSHSNSQSSSGSARQNAASAVETHTERWPDNHQHGSPVPRPLGRQKRVAEQSSVPPLSQHLPWQIDLGQAKAAPQLVTPVMERLLPIGTAGLALRNAQQPLKPEESYGSPESPLSKMDVMTVGSPVELDSENFSSDVTSTCSMSQLEMPMQERLLPIGSKDSKTEICNLVDKVRRALGVPAVEETAADAEYRPSTLPEPSSTSPTANKHESYGAPEVRLITAPQKEEVLSGRSSSPRRLIKQVALDSSPPHMQGDTEESRPGFYRAVHHDRKPPAVKQEEHIRNQRQRTKKTGLFTIGQHLLTDFPRHPGSWCGPQHQPLLDPATQQACHAEFDLKQSSLRVGEDCISQRCSECGTIKEEYSDEELALCIIVLGTFIHREPVLAAPMLPDILSSVARIALNASYPWQNETNIYLPGGAISVAQQFLRCVLHQLAPNGVFLQMFQTEVEESSRMQFFRSVAQALLDFNELNPVAPLQLLLESLNSKKSLPVDTLPVIIHNMACYLDCLPLEQGYAAWLLQLEALLRRLSLTLHTLQDVLPLLRIMVAVLKVPGISQFKGLLEPFSKILSYGIQNCVLKYHYLVDLCYLCGKGFTRERDKLILTRMVVFELVQALKFKTSIPDANFLMLINFILQDVGGTLPSHVMMQDISSLVSEGMPVFSTNASECMKQHLPDLVEFLIDFHALTKIKSYSKGPVVGLNEDTLGGVLKSGVAQYLALEITRGNSRDNRAIARYLPWLYNSTSTLQQGPRELQDCVGHMRLLSWLLLGSLQHTAQQGGHAHCQPVPQEASCHITDHVQVVLAGFTASVLHTPVLFHVFLLCQLWTIYLEQSASVNPPNSDAHTITMGIMLDFWGKVTPCVLQLISHSKMLAEMVNLHFIGLLEALLECNSTALGKLMPVWNPVFFAHNAQLPRHLQIRLQTCLDFAPVAPATSHQQHGTANTVLMRWLQRLQFKMAQMEMQSSSPTQFLVI
ncbi:protein unc-79 homolog [Bacillus rossius redtenbacheri]|uniref:protein unc-79 homolog n=1 Tax=Bacillus rossius redtenbacheri TaxID=93214 RepID=UPI002FDF0487